MFCHADRRQSKSRKGSEKLSRMVERLFDDADANDYDVMLLVLEADKKSSLQKRTTEPSWGSYNAVKREAQVKEPTTEAEDSGRASSSAKQSNSTAPRGILPQCYADKDQCVKTTNNCSGHGTCQKKFGLPSSEICYECSCRAEKKDGLTTVWSGPACQKKDISAPFWIITIASLSLVSLLAYGLTLLVSMGNEELPSVLGSGVPALGAKNNF